MGSVEGEAEESGLDHWKQPYCTTARPGRLAEAGFGVGGEESLVSLAEAVGTQAVTRPTDCQSVDNRGFPGVLGNPGLNPSNETLGKGTLCRERNCKWQRNEWGGTRRNSAA